MIRVHLMKGFDERFVPIPAPLHKAWWQDNSKTKNHAQHCLPLSMANSLGYLILSPVTFTVEWDGDVQRNAKVTIIDKMPCADVDDHAAFGSFTIQPGFIPTTQNVGDFIMIKNIANERGVPYTCMEAMIEGWWSPSNFGLVFLLNQPGKFMLSMGQPIAQMCVFRQEGGMHKLDITNEMPPQYAAWLVKRQRPNYHKDLDYMHGRHHDGKQEATHLSSWKREL